MGVGGEKGYEWVEGRGQGKIRTPEDRDVREGRRGRKRVLKLVKGKHKETPCSH